MKRKYQSSTWLMMFLLVLAVSFGFSNKVSAEELVNISISGVLDFDEANKCLELVNKERAAAGLNPVVMDAQLQREAMLRAQECAIYYSHTRPHGESCFTAYTHCSGENIVTTFWNEKANRAMELLMNSPGHRAAILDSSYKSIGIGCFFNGSTVCWVQAFSTLQLNSSVINGKQNSSITIPTLLSNLDESYLSLADRNNVEEYFNKFSIKEKEKIHLCVSYIGSVFEDSNFTWSSSAPATVSVDANGVVTGRKAGTATITAALKADPRKKASIAVSVSHTHKYTTKVVKPTAKEKGYTLHTCSCGKSYKDNWKPVIRKMVVKLSQTTMNYTGKTLKPKVTVTVNGKKLSSKDYSVGFKNNKNVGTATVTIKGKGSYKGCSSTAKFKIVKPKFQVKLSKTALTYNGKTQKPKVTVYAGKKKLSGKYYSVSFKNNKNVGMATVTVKGKGSYRYYSGTATFKINLKKAVLSSLKASGKGRLEVRWKRSSGNSGYQIQYAANSKFKSAKSRTIGGAGKTGCTLSGLKSRQTYYVRVRTYKKVGGKTWYGSWSTVQKGKVR